MVPLRWVAPSRVSDPAPGHATPFRLHGDSRVPLLHVPSVWMWMLQGPRGHSGSPLQPGHDGLVHHS
jgi:hypothetical protein